MTASEPAHTLNQSCLTSSILSKSSIRPSNSHTRYLLSQLNSWTSPLPSNMASSQHQCSTSPLMLTHTCISTPLITPTPKPAFPTPSSSAYVDSALTMKTFSHSPTRWLSFSQPGTTPTWLLTRHSSVSSRYLGLLPSVRFHHPTTTDQWSLCASIPTTFRFVGSFVQTGIYWRTALQLDVHFATGPLSLSKQTSTFAACLCGRLCENVSLPQRHAPSLALLLSVKLVLTLCADTSVQGPSGHMQVRRGFTCQGDNLVYWITCQTCGMMYVGETARALVISFTEHLAAIRHNRKKPVAQHFNWATHTTMDQQLKGYDGCTGTPLSENTGSPTPSRDWHPGGPEGDSNLHQRHLIGHLSETNDEEESRDWAPCAQKA